MIKQVSAQFKVLFNNIAKVISFNKNWHAGVGSLDSIIHHEFFRLILTPWEVAKTTDNYKRQVVMLGTPYGLLIMYQESLVSTTHPNIRYDMTEMLASKIPHSAGLFQHGRLTFSQLEYIFSDKFTEDIEAAVADDLSKGKKICDGLKLFERAAPKNAYEKKKQYRTNHKPAPKTQQAAAQA